MDNSLVDPHLGFPPLPAGLNSGPPLPAAPPAAPEGNVDFSASSRTPKRRGRPPGSGSKQKDAPGVLGVGVQNTGGVPAALPEGNVDSSDASGGTSSSGTSKRRGRPPGSSNKPKDATGAGIKLKPHMITVNEGQDIASTIFGLQGPRRVCILSTTGSVSDVTLRQLAPPGFAFHAGLHDIITLQSSLPESDDKQVVLNLEMAGKGNAVYGGEVLGELRAASEIKITVGSFVDEKGKKTKGGSSPAPGPMGGAAAAGEAVHCVPVYWGKLQ